MKKVSIVFSVMRFFGVKLNDLVAYRKNQSVAQSSPEQLKQLPLEILYEGDYRSFFFEADKIPVAIIVGNIGFSFEEAPETMDWFKAEEYCKRYSIGGKEWSLPNKDAGHLVTLYKNKKDINLVLKAFGKEPLTEYFYWASEYLKLYAWTIYLSDDSVSNNHKGKYGYVRPLTLL